MFSHWEGCAFFPAKVEVVRGALRVAKTAIDTAAQIAVRVGRWHRILEVRYSLGCDNG